MSFEKTKRLKSEDTKTTKCYSCKQIGFWKSDCPNESGNNGSTNVVQSDGSCSGEDLLCVSSTKLH